VAVSKPVYADMKTQDITKARMVIKEFTRHNDKLGFDFSIPNNGYYASYSQQFSVDPPTYGGSTGFLAQASKFYMTQNTPDLTRSAAHFTKMAKLFTLSPEDAPNKRAFAVPVDMGADRRIEGYLRKINDLEETVERTERNLRIVEEENQSNQRTIKGYHDSVVLTPHQVLDYPQKLRNNVRKIINSLQTTDETRYVKALLDPFHPDTLGVRIPSRVPRNTITYNTHCEFSFKATASVSDVMVISNFEQLSGDKLVSVSGSAV